MLQKTRNRLLVVLFICTACIELSAQDSADAPEPVIRLRYFQNNNSVQYLLVESALKTGKKSQPLPRQAVKLFLDSNKAESMIIKTNTDENGKAKVIIPPALQDQWNGSPKHSFIGVLEATGEREEIETSLEITKAKMIMDTSTTDGIHSITVQVMYFENNDWVPAMDVEMKVGVKRSGSILSAGEETYTTDSTGSIVAEFKRDSLPGDQQGNVVLVAKVEDNDIYGNLLVEKMNVPWGKVTKPETGFFDQRTLWSTRFRTPPWLLIMAGFIIISVWSTLIYLVIQIVRIKKLGKINV